MSDMYENWPENLPREDLVHFVRGAVSEAVDVEDILGAALGYPLGDGVIWPKDRRVTGEHTTVTLAMAAARRIKEMESQFEAAATAAKRAHETGNLYDLEDVKQAVLALIGQEKR